MIRNTRRTAFRLRMRRKNPRLSADISAVNRRTDAVLILRLYTLKTKCTTLIFTEFLPSAFRLGNRFFTRSPFVSCLLTFFN